MKTCPVCKARCFDDMEVCFGCMHRFKDGVQEGESASVVTAQMNTPQAVIAPGATPAEAAPMSSVPAPSEVAPVPSAPAPTEPVLAPIAAKHEEPAAVQQVSTQAGATPVKPSSEKETLEKAKSGAVQEHLQEEQAFALPAQYASLYPGYQLVISLVPVGAAQQQVQA